eukprot:1213158-Amphidinium_carterae.1
MEPSKSEAKALTTVSAAFDWVCIPSVVRDAFVATCSGVPLVALCRPTPKSGRWVGICVRRQW